jgi:hypothetical protein
MISISMGWQETADESDEWSHGFVRLLLSVPRPCSDREAAGLASALAGTGAGLLTYPGLPVASATAKTVCSVTGWAGGPSGDNREALGLPAGPDPFLNSSSKDLRTVEVAEEDSAFLRSSLSWPAVRTPAGEDPGGEHGDQACGDQSHRPGEELVEVLHGELMDRDADAVQD